LVNDLVELFPAAQASHQAICEIEVSELGTNERFPSLREIASVRRSGWSNIDDDFIVKKNRFIASFIKFKKELTYSLSTRESSFGRA